MSQSAPTEEQVRRWKAKVATIPETLTMKDYTDAEVKILGSEYDLYLSYKCEQNRQQALAWAQPVTKAQFAAALKSLDYNSHLSLFEFRQLLLRPNFEHIVIGRVQNTLLKLILCPSELEDHYFSQYMNQEDPDEGEEDEEGEQDTRASVSVSVLGLWQDYASYRRGDRSDEGYYSESSESTLVHPQGFPKGLEVFQNLGLLFAKDMNKPGKFAETNYVLVASVYDDSLWVIWRKYIKDDGQRLLAKDYWPGAYCAFPGIDPEGFEVGTVMYAKIADNWDSLNPSATTTLRFRQITHAPSKRNQLASEPNFVAAVRTPQGGIRRQNDFRSMQPRAKRA
ncbi:hypothetical protein ACLMJK_007651 [Lecanora helva]